jgi:hypothetical protein
MSDTLIRSVGYAGRDLFESMLNYGLVNQPRRRSSGDGLMGGISRAV